MKEFIKRLLKSSRLGRLMYEPIHQVYRLYSVPHRRKILQQIGREVLQKISVILDRNEVDWFVAAGTLLGFVREGRFMRHDDDIDIGVLPGKWSPIDLLQLLVEKEGFKFEFAFQFRGKVVEFKVSYKGIPVDFFCYHREGNDLYCTCFYFFPEICYPSSNANSVWRIHEYNFFETKRINVIDVDVAVPLESEKVLSQLYGEDWKIPNPHWDDSMHPGREVMNGEYGYSISYEEAVSLKS